MVEPTVESVREELAALEDPKVRAVNEKHGDDHGVKLSGLRAVAKALKKNEQLAVDLWATGETPLRLVALLICRPKQFGADELDEMLRDARVPKVTDWLINYVVKKSPHADELREAWHDDADPAVAAGAWALAADRAVREPEVLDLEALLNEIESEMKEAPARKQWEMNNTLAAIGIAHPDLRKRAIDIGERLEVLKDYPTPPGCTSPYAPLWIGEIVSRQKT
ncbi:DNA alkylation repair protein [Microbacterium sp. G2-8]|uniref:DNA alkylation repair protein n=1 Tax=Microbacterium sp. G2-8 TaxID=2842454 RepID=UPI001C8AC578|nr:DNA alkylation repair protein [Microbacterium sp. G2-8]